MKKKYFVLLIISLLLINSSFVKAETYKYDNLNRVLSLTYDNGDIVQYNYDNGGNLLSTARIDHVNVTSLVVNSSQVNLKVGGSYKLLTAATFKDNKTYDITKYASYVVSDTNIVAIDNTGVIRGNTEGQASIEVGYADKKVLVNVNIVNEKNTEIETTEPKEVKGEVLSTSTLLESNMLKIEDDNNSSSTSGIGSSVDGDKTDKAGNKTEIEAAENGAKQGSDSETTDSNKANNNLVSFILISVLVALGGALFLKKK